MVEIPACVGKDMLLIERGDAGAGSIPRVRGSLDAAAPAHPDAGSVPAEVIYDYNGEPEANQSCSGSRSTPSGTSQKQSSGSGSVGPKATLDRYQGIAGRGPVGHGQ